jgi:hypothetical protein
VKDQNIIPATVYCPKVTLEDLLTEPTLLQQPATSEGFQAIRTTLTYPTDAKIRYGTFKLAFPATTTEVVVGTTRSVCLKQVFYSSGDLRKPCDEATQVKELTIEMACLIWAEQLLGLVYHFISETGLSQGEPSSSTSFAPQVPQFRFVGCGLAFSDDRNHIFLVEELINRSEGPFYKFINNRSACPLFELLPKDEEYQTRARFLAFAQHVQYVKTEGMVYFSDLQGFLARLFPSLLLTAGFMR